MPFATRLRQALFKRFREFDEEAVFLDINSIEGGANFPECLRQAIDAAAVFLVVVHPNWVDARKDGLRRLDDPTDFVRREIQQALGRLHDAGRPLVVIPIFCDGGTLPHPDKAGDFPDSLRLLLDANGFNYSWEQLDKFEIDDLERTIRKRLELPDTFTRPHADADSLPYLCDRDNQHLEFCSVVDTHMKGPCRHRPLLCVIHGPADEAHWELVRRLSRLTLHECLPAEMTREMVDPRPLPWNVPLANAESFKQYFREALVQRLELARMNPVKDELIVEGLRRLRLKVVVVEQSLHAQDLRDATCSHMTRQLEYWSDFPPLPENTLLLSFACLKYSEEPPSLVERILPIFGRRRLRQWTKWIDEFENKAAELSGKVTCKVLTKLPRLCLSDLETWGKLPQVAEYGQQKKLRSLPLTQDKLRRIFGERDELPMDVVGTKLRDLLDGVN